MNSKLTGKGAAKSFVKKKALMSKKSIDIFNSTATFEPRHENENCSACPEDQLEPF